MSISLGIPNLKCIPASETTESLLEGLFEQLDRVRRAVNETEELVYFPRTQCACEASCPPSETTLNDKLRIAVGITNDQASKLIDINKDVKAAIGDVKLL